MQALKKRAVLRARRDLQTSADFVRWLSWPNGARGADQTASQSKSAPEVGRRRASVPACSSTQPAADHVWPPSAEIDVGAVLMPGCRHREAAGGQSGPDLASHRKKAKVVKRYHRRSASKPTAGRPPGTVAGRCDPPASCSIRIWKKIPSAKALLSAIGVVAGSP